MSKNNLIYRIVYLINLLIKYNQKSFLKYPYFIQKKPIVINLNANDICNSKCVMCNIWTNKQKFEFSPSQLEKILSDDLFSEVRHVGITGGEPTLRADLPLLYEACIKALPKLKAVSIITNAIKERTVIERISDVAAVCRKYKIGFSIMVSLDGVGRVHDNIRRRDGNFKSAMRVIDYFRNNTELDVSIGCTISKGNVWEVNELLYFLRKENLYGRFRIAEFINRLYNDDKKAEIRNFDEDESYHLALFFKKLEYAYEKNYLIRRTYRSIHSMLLGGRRKIGCPYQTEGIVLNSTGDLQYCAPKSKVIGNSINESAIKIYKGNLKERRRIIKNHCDDCIHDYHAPVTFKEAVEAKKDGYWKKALSIDISGALLKRLNLLASLKGRIYHDSRKHIFIIGWYGTETVGDKAILGGIVNHYKKEFGDNVRFSISGIYPFVTERTLRELQVRAEVVNVYSLEFIRHARYADLTVMGGGPLMDLEHLFIPDIGFRVSRLNQKKTVVFGCGIGPLFQDRFKTAVRSILNNADVISLRDSHSEEIAKSLTGRHDVSNIGDMAKPYVIGKSASITKEKRNEIACFLREWTYEYRRDVPYEDFCNLKERFELSLAKFILSMAKEKGINRIRLYHMHNFVVGNDDRDFSIYFIDKYFNDNDGIIIDYDKKLSTVDSIIAAMKSSEFNICMRFHSVLFAHTLQTDFVAIDYTGGGKIYNYLKDENSLGNLIDINDLIEAYSVSTSC